MPLGLRVTPPVKSRLEIAAQESGRSLSQEAEFRLEHSFDREGLLPEVLTLAFGSRQTAGLVWMLGIVIDAVGRAAQEAPVRTQTLLGQASDSHWMFDPVAFREVQSAVHWLLRVHLNPAQHPPTGKYRGLRRTGVNIGRDMAMQIAKQTFESTRSKGNETTEIIASLKKLLGPQIANNFKRIDEQLRAAESIDDKQERARPEKVSGYIARAILDLIASKQGGPSQEELTAAIAAILKRRPSVGEVEVILREADSHE